MNLYNFQQKAVEWLASKPRAILGSEVGTGKTAVAIKAAEKVLKNETVFVVCPSSVKYVWQREIEKWRTQFYGRVRVLEKLSETISPIPGWYIMSYEYLTANHTKLPVPDILIPDEAHYLQSFKSKRTKAILQHFGKRCPRVWLLTGTPFPNSLINAWTLFAFCTSGRIGKYWEFAYKYCYVENNRFGKKPYGCRADMLPDLVQRVKPILHRDTVEDNLAELPSYQEIKVPLVYSKDALAIVQTMEATREEWEGALENEQMTISASSLYRELGKTKIPQAVSFIEDLLAQDLQVVIFAHHQEVVHQIWESLYLDHTTRAISGDTDAKAREEYVGNFQKGAVRCIILSILAAGVGITLTAARVAVFVELFWTAASLEQAKARIRRIGQKNFCTYYFLQYPNSIDEIIYKNVKGKQRDIDKFWGEFEGKRTDESEEIVWP